VLEPFIYRLIDCFLLNFEELSLRQISAVHTPTHVAIETNVHFMVSA
jgi:hypothetical protein